VILRSSLFICIFKHTGDALSKTERSAKPCLLLHSSAFIKLGSAEHRVSEDACQGFRETGVRGSERRKCVVEEKLYWQSKICGYAVKYVRCHSAVIAPTLTAGGQSINSCCNPEAS
jgi:hypothetical protein